MSKRILNHSPKKVALVGMGPSIMDYIGDTMTQEFSPDFADEIWCINMATCAFHADMVIWMDDLYQQETFKPNLMSFLRRRGTPVLTSKSYPDIIPNSYDYPIDEVGRLSLKLFGKPYLTNGVAQAIAYGSVIGVKEMTLYGCDFTYPNREYAESGRACVEAWIAAMVAVDTMEIRLSKRTSLFDAVDDKGIYGYETQPTITLPDGSQFQMGATLATATSEYTPEDSSGQPPKETKADVNISGSLPGANGGTTDSGRSGIDGANGSTPVEAPTVARSGESLRNPGEAGWNQK